MRAYSAMDEELKNKGHLLIEKIEGKGHQKIKIYRALSSYMGYRGKATSEIGFHFRKPHTIVDFEKAVEWLQRAFEQNTLSPSKKKQDPLWDETLPQLKMNEALKNL